MDNPGTLGAQVKRWTTCTAVGLIVAGGAATTASAGNSSSNSSSNSSMNSSSNSSSNSSRHQRMKVKCAKKKYKWTRACRPYR